MNKDYHSPTKLCDGAQITNFWRFLQPVFPASLVQHVSDLHPKFALRPHHVWNTIRYDIEDIYVHPKANIYPAKSAERNQTKKSNEETKNKTQMLRRNGPVIKPWSES